MDKIPRNPRPNNINLNPEAKKLPSGKKKLNIKNKKFLLPVIGAVILILAIVIIIANITKPSYEEYDLKGLTIKEACEKARGAGWKVDEIHHIENYSDKTDCYNTEKTVTRYDYLKYNKEVDIYYGEKKTEEEKQAECEANGKWYRNGSCKTQEEWENDYKWQEAHAACKKYGANAYAKTLTDCYVGNEYKGTVDGQAASSSSSSSSSNSSPSSSSSSSSAEWRQFLKDYEAWVDSYVSFMKKYKNASASEMASMMSDYSRLMSEISTWSQKASDWQGKLTAGDLTEYLNTLARITEKINSIK